MRFPVALGVGECCDDFFFALGNRFKEPSILMRGWKTLDQLYGFFKSIKA
jgi:hypothetical protein